MTVKAAVENFYQPDYLDELAPKSVLLGVPIVDQDLQIYGPRNHQTHLQVGIGQSMIGIQRLDGLPIQVAINSLEEGENRVRRVFAKPVGRITIVRASLDVDSGEPVPRDLDAETHGWSVFDEQLPIVSHTGFEIFIQTLGYYGLKKQGQDPEMPADHAAFLRLH